MLDRTQTHHRYQFSLSELWWFTSVLMFGLGCMRMGFARDSLTALPLVIGGLAISGGALGAAVGRAFEDDRGGVTWLGAYLGSVGTIGLLFLSPLLYVLVLLAKRYFGG